MGREFYLYVESGEFEESVKLFGGRGRCELISVLVLGTACFDSDLEDDDETRSGNLDKAEIDRLCLLFKECEEVPLKEIIKDDKQIEFFEPKYDEECGYTVLKNAVKLIYFHQLPSAEFLAHVICEDEGFRDLMKKIKEENLDFKIYILDSYWYDVLVFFSNKAQRQFLPYINERASDSKLIYFNF